MFRRSWLLLSLTTIPLLACGQLPSEAIRNGDHPEVTQAESLTEPVLDEAAQDRLARRSPEALIDDAAPEPGVSTVGFEPPKEDLGHFGTVTPSIWRGARPTVKGLIQLKAKGVRTIVNLENDRKVVEFERQWCEANGVDFVSLPMSVITPPRMTTVNRWLDLAQTSSRLPLYVHCMQGRDRTGTVVYTYRVKVQGWTHDKAYPEMVAFKFHTYLLGLRAFVWWYGRTQQSDVGLESFPGA
jgi:protein-tyrosine phosphatase